MATASGIAGWNTILHLGDQSTAALTTPQTGDYILGLTNDVHMGPTSPELVTPGLVRDGTAVLKKQYIQPGKITPAYTGFQTPLSATSFQWLMTNLMQDVGVEDVGGTKASSPYTTDAAAVYFTFLKYMEATAGGTEADSCMVNHLAIDCPADGMCGITFDFLAITERIGTVALNTPTALTGPGILTKDAVVTWDGDAVNQIAMSFDFTNGAFHDHQQAQAPTAILKGQFGMTGSITMEWDEALANAIDTDLRAGYDVIPANEWDLICTWGSEDTDGYVMITCAVAVNGQPTLTEADGYQQLTVPWTMVSGTVTPSVASSATVPFVKTA